MSTRGFDNETKLNAVAARFNVVTVAGTSYTLALTDAESLLVCTNGSAVTVTVPTNASVEFLVGTQITLYQQGAGQITVAAAGGVTIEQPETLKSRAQYCCMTLVKRATNTWVLVGETELA